MRICVAGLWHLGTVTAACLSSLGHDVTALADDDRDAERLARGHAPLHEPGLDALVTKGVTDGRLHVTADPEHAVAGASIVWVAYDTPVDADDRADVDWVVARIGRLLPLMSPATLVLVSSQLPVGTTRRLEAMAAQAEHEGGPRLRFAYAPENLRLGRAIDTFMHPDRIVVGVRAAADRDQIAELLTPVTDRIEWMTVESAEMTKHALNAFLATSVAFTNEIATVCEATGADAAEVERGLRSDPRVGRLAYVTPGGAFAGGTLARDVVFLSGLGREHGVDTQLLAAVTRSNDSHRAWTRRRLEALIGDPDGVTVAVWGLTYKPGTDTLRRSAAIELCRWLAEAGCSVRAHDPVVRRLPDDLARALTMTSDALSAADGASALVVATPWPEYRDADAGEVVRRMQRPLVLDAGRFLRDSLGADPTVEYVSVGQAPARGRA